MKQTVTRSNKHLQEIFIDTICLKLLEQVKLMKRTSKNWKSSTETTETMKLNGKLMKRTVTISNKHLK